MPNPIHPPQLYAVVKLVRSYVWRQIGRKPTMQEVADCLAGAAGTIAGLETLHEGRTAQLYTEAKLLSQEWVATNNTTKH